MKQQQQQQQQQQPIAGPSNKNSTPKKQKQEKIKLRIADHLLTAPGVSFAKNLSIHSSIHGTIEKITKLKKKTQTQTQTQTQTKTQTQTQTQTPSSESIETTTSTSTSTVQDNKPKSWADLLKKPNQKNNHTEKIYHQHTIQHNPELVLAEKLSILRLQDKPFYLIPRGLINNGNICFANAILQVLVHCPPFFNLMQHLSEILKQEMESKTPLLDSMIEFIHEFQTIHPTFTHDYLFNQDTLHSSFNDIPFFAENVWLATKHNFRFDGMRRGQQEDAQEFLCFFLDTLHEELLYVTSKHDSNVIKKNYQNSSSFDQMDSSTHLLNDNYNHQALNSSSGEWLHVGAKGQAAITRSTDPCPSPLTELFDLKTRSVLHRSGQKDSVTFEPTNMLQLTIEDSTISTIEEALAHFSSPEVISDMLSKNGQRVSATKQVYIESFPPILVLHLKRFHFNHQLGNVVKSNKSIKFGNSLIIPNNVRSPAQRSLGPEGQIKFHLFAVVYHHGPHASGGHYTVSIRQPATDNWIYIDDTNITPSQIPYNNHNTSSNGTNQDHSSHHTRNLGSHFFNASTLNFNTSSNHFDADIKTPYLLFYTR